VHILYTYIFCVIGPCPPPLLQNHSSAHGGQSCVVTLDLPIYLLNLTFEF